jgi:hypothetical protein|nr:MAG TPA: tail completion protein [Caudoviricetes sp.]
MIKFTDLKRACNAVVSTTFPDVKVYGNDTTDGYTRPAFFTELIPHPFAHETKNYASGGATYKATLLEKTHDEVFCLSIYDGIREAFGMTLPVGDRKLLVGDISFEFIGEHLDILQISVEFDWYEQKKRIEREPLADTLIVAMEKKGD